MVKVNSWHLDKKVPMLMIFWIVMQFIGLIIWGARVSAEVRYITDDLASIKLIQKERGKQLGEIVGLQTEVRNLVYAVKRLERKLDTQYGWKPQ